MIKMRMSEKEMQEGRRAGIPDAILGKMSIGMELTDRENEIVRSRGKVYVPPHLRAGKKVRPHLRDFLTGLTPKGYKVKFKEIEVEEIRKTSMGYEFVISDKVSPYDEFLGDKIGGVEYLDFEEFTNTFLKQQYSEEEMINIYDELRYSEFTWTPFKLPKPLKIEVQYHVRDWI